MGLFNLIAKLIKERDLEDIYYLSLEAMAERGYPPDSVEKTEDEVLFHVDEEEEKTDEEDKGSLFTMFD